MQVQLTPCPFCEGPPVPFATSNRAGFAWEKDGTIVDAFVFCHECGAEGPHTDKFCDAEEDVGELLEEAVRLWQERSARHRDLYDAGELRGLNLYPRTAHNT